jgi:hypothetical protein
VLVTGSGPDDILFQNFMCISTWHNAVLCACRNDYRQWLEEGSPRPTSCQDLIGRRETTLYQSLEVPQVRNISTPKPKILHLFLLSDSPLLHAAPVRDPLDQDWTLDQRVKGSIELGLVVQ